jgi:hypothetical protein
MPINNMPAYTISNENQRWATNAVRGAAVLTVAGSGDQALFYKLSGAKFIDTFDITYNAKVIQDIKSAAIKHINRVEYIKLLENLHFANGELSISLLQKYDIWNSLTKESREAIENHAKDMLFMCGLSAHSYPENIPTEKEYAKLKSSLNKHFNFIWSEISDLSKKLTRKYDIINISNIFDYIRNANNQRDILKDLSEHLKTNGRILYLSQYNICRYSGLKLDELEYEKTIPDNKNINMIVFQRTR